MASGLFGDQGDAGTRLTRRGGTGQQQRTGAGDDDALIGDFNATLDQRLQAAGAGHARQGPAGKRQQQFAGAGAEDEGIEGQRAAACSVFQQQLVRAQGRGYPGLGEQGHIRRQAADFGGDLAHTGTPDLSARQGIVVQQHQVQAAATGRAGSGETGRTGADDE